MATRIGIAGVTGRMGRLLVEEVRSPPAPNWLAASAAPVVQPRRRPAWRCLPDIAALAAASDVVVDFTNAATAQSYAAAMAESGKAWVLGTSGLSAADEAAVADGGRAASPWSMRPTSRPA